MGERRVSRLRMEVEVSKVWKVSEAHSRFLAQHLRSNHCLLRTKKTYLWNVGSPLNQYQIRPENGSWRYRGSFWEGFNYLLKSGPLRFLPPFDELHWKGGGLRGENCGIAYLRILTLYQCPSLQIQFSEVVSGEVIVFLCTHGGNHWVIS